MMFSLTPTSIPDSNSGSIPKEITIQSDVMTCTESVGNSSAVSPCVETFARLDTQTVCDEGNKMTTPRFNSGIVSLSSDSNSYDDITDTIPLDFRLGGSIDINDSLRHSISQNLPIFMNSIISMDVDSLCARPNEWEIESICADDLDKEEDMASIPQWINSRHEDIWIH